jgi:hypothetical protein
MLTEPAFLAPLLANGLGLVFYIILLIFTIYTVFLVYHWFAYGTRYATALLALSIYLLVSAPFFIVMAITL